jgi:hypothetical protein
MENTNLLIIVITLSSSILFTGIVGTVYFLSKSTQVPNNVLRRQNTDIELNNLVQQPSPIYSPQGNNHFIHDIELNNIIEFVPINNTTSSDIRNELLGN